MERINAPVAKGLAQNLLFVFIVSVANKLFEERLFSFNDNFRFTVNKVPQGFLKDHKRIPNLCLKKDY